jgi:hypothetical protein
MVRFKYNYILAISLLLGSCHHENMQDYPPEFNEYVDEFFYQAHQRGLSLYPQNLNFSIQFGETDDELGGFCNTKGNAITINVEDWERRDHAEREHVIFHELGHCILNRNHRNDESVTNECFSYMRGAEDDFDCSLNLHSGYWRDYYLDELFDSSSNLPGWYLSSQDYPETNLNYTDSIVINDTLTYNLENNSFRYNQRDTFLFEMIFNSTNTTEKSVGFYIGNLAFLHCDECTLTKTSLQLGNKRIFSIGGPALNSEIKFSVFRNNDVISFFVNDDFVHAMEYTIIEGNRFKTLHFDEEMGMSLRYLFN